MQAKLMDIKKYQIQVGKQQKRDVEPQEAIKQLEENNHKVDKAIENALQQ